MIINKCNVDGCQKPKRRNGAKTLYCHMHYKRFLTYGNVGQSNEHRIYSYAGKICKINECNKMAKKKDMCTFHYDSQKGSLLSAESIAEMKKTGCNVCGSFSRLTLDHDHSCCPVGRSCTNCVRGILCHKCNTAAGLLDDDSERMIALSAYILAHKGGMKVWN